MRSRSHDSDDSPPFRAELSRAAQRGLEHELQLWRAARGDVVQSALPDALDEALEQIARFPQIGQRIERPGRHARKYLLEKVGLYLLVQPRRRVITVFDLVPAPGLRHR